MSAGLSVVFGLLNAACMVYWENTSHRMAIIRLSADIFGAWQGDFTLMRLQWKSEAEWILMTRPNLKSLIIKSWNNSFSFSICAQPSNELENRQRVVVSNAMCTIKSALYWAKLWWRCAARCATELDRYIFNPPACLGSHARSVLQKLKSQCANWVPESWHWVL